MKVAHNRSGAGSCRASFLRRGLMVGALFALVAVLNQQDARAQSRGYLAGHEVDFHTILGPPPAVDSRWDRAVQELVEDYQKVDEARFESARLDEQQLYSRFDT